MNLIQTGLDGYDTYAVMENSRDGIQRIRELEEGTPQYVKEREKWIKAYPSLIVSTTQYVIRAFIVVCIVVLIIMISSESSVSTIDRTKTERQLHPNAPNSKVNLGPNSGMYLLYAFGLAFLLGGMFWWTNRSIGKAMEKLTGENLYKDFYEINAASSSSRDRANQYAISHWFDAYYSKFGKPSGY